jgi:hypothetical protein
MSAPSNTGTGTGTGISPAVHAAASASPQWRGQTVAIIGQLSELPRELLRLIADYLPRATLTVWIFPRLCRVCVDRPAGLQLCGGIGQ